jgi:hypothetical protein
MAVLGEIKKMGLMKLYALLTKARVQGVEGGALVLGFPEDALFQMRVLAESPEDLSAIEGTWERFVGEPAKVKLVSLSARPERQAEAAPGSRPPGPAEDVGEMEQTGEEEAGATEAQMEGQDPAPDRPRKADSKDIANLLKERFDGEIIENKKEGKD